MRAPLASLTLAASLACSGGPDDVELLPFTEDEARTIASGDYCLQAEWVVRTPEAWSTLWSYVVAGRDPKPPAPAVDFLREAVLFVAWGARPSSGFTVDFTRAVDQGGIVRVAVLYSSPGPSCVTLPVITCPAAAVRIARPNDPVVYVPFSEVQDCGG